MGRVREEKRREGKGREGEEEEEEEEKRRKKKEEDQKRASLRRTKIQVREKVRKARNTAFLQ
jgi:hypothetical protein